MDDRPATSCIGATCEGVREQLATLCRPWASSARVAQVICPVALWPGGPSRRVPVSDLVAFIRAETGDHFHRGGRLKRTHRRSPQTDLQAFATKVRAGANSAITQYFYNPDAYFVLWKRWMRWA